MNLKESVDLLKKVQIASYSSEPWAQNMMKTELRLCGSASVVVREVNRSLHVSVGEQRENRGERMAAAKG